MPAFWPGLCSSECFQERVSKRAVFPRGATHASVMGYCIQFLLACGLDLRCWLALVCSIGVCVLAIGVNCFSEEKTLTHSGSTEELGLTFSWVKGYLNCGSNARASILGLIPPFFSVKMSACFSHVLAFGVGKMGCIFGERVHLGKSGDGSVLCGASAVPRWRSLRACV